MQDLVKRLRTSEPKHALQRVVLIALLCAALMLGSTVPTHGSTTNLGTLKCMLDPATEEPFGIERELSCSFSPVTGPPANLIGVAKKIGVHTPSQEKIVLVWSVLGPSREGSAERLEGRYVSRLGSGLIGGQDSSIALRPLTVGPSVGENLAISILELELSATIV